MTVHHLHHLHYHRLHLLLLVQSIILNLRLGSSANPFLHRPFPFLPDWFHDSRTISCFYSAQRLDLFASCVSRLLVGFRTHFKSMHFELQISRHGHAKKKKKKKKLFPAPENVRQCAVGCPPARRPSPRTGSSSREKWRHSTTEARTSRQTREYGWTRRCCGSRPDRNCRSIPTERRHTNTTAVSLRPVDRNLPQGRRVGDQYAGDLDWYSFNIKSCQYAAIQYTCRRRKVR